MLVFLLIFYLYYDLFNCDETGNAKFNESIMIDKYHQNFLQINELLKDLQQKVHEKSVLIVGEYEHKRTRDEDFDYDNIAYWRRRQGPGLNQTETSKAHETIPIEFHPSPQYDPAGGRQGQLNWLPPFFPGFKAPLPALVTRQPTSSLLPLKNLRERPRLPYPKYLLRPVYLLNPSLPQLLSDYGYQNIYLRPPGASLPSPSYTPGPTSPRREPFLYSDYYQQKPHPINLLRPTVSPPILDLAVSPKTSPPVKIPSSTVRTTVGEVAKIWLQEIAPYTPIKEKNKKTSKDQSLDDSEKTTVPFNEHENEHGFHYVPPPENDEIKAQTKDSDKNWLSTMVGDVLHGNITVQEPSTTPSPKQHYVDLLQQLNEGYMILFMLELCRIIAVKDRQEVRDVLFHTERIYESLRQDGRLAWIGDPLETVVWKLSIINSEKDIDRVRAYTSMMFHMLLQRKQVLSAEVNSMIDEAESFYNNDEGDRLISSLKQFEDYPNTTKNSYRVCNGLIESFLMPFRRLSRTSSRQRLFDSINRGLNKRFPLLLKEYNEETLAGKESPKDGLRLREKNRKQRHLLYKDKQEGQSHRTPEYNNKSIYGEPYSQDIHLKDSIWGTMTPVTSHQPRFRANATKSYRKKSRRTTVYSDIVSLSIRNKKPNYQKTSTFQETLRTLDRRTHKSTKTTVHPHRHFSRKTSTSEHRPRPPLRVATSSGSLFLAANGFHLPNQWNGGRNNKIVGLLR